MNLDCPSCKSEQTQKITAIVDNGTTHSRGKTVSTGVGSVGGKFALGSSVGTTNTTHKSELAAKLSAPKKLSEGYVLGAMFYVIVIAIVSSQLFILISNRAGWFLILLEIVFFVVAFLATSYFVIKAKKQKSNENKKYNSTEYVRLFDLWANGYYCHRCENIFVPQ